MDTGEKISDTQRKRKTDSAQTSAANRPVIPAVRIGSSQEQVRRDLMVVGGILREILEPAGITLIDEVDRFLNQLSSTIAVIGQIKAGKSCIVNALIGQHDLLPTDVNPSTSAITQLHFNQASPSGNAAVFRFFTLAEWASLASGEGQLRTLTRRLVPDFEPERLRQSIHDVRARAVRRLGSEYERKLLGQSHAFDKVEPETLQMYVCAGDTQRRGSKIGLYSEITKTADLYLPEGPFDFPVTIVDTPGTNDPFLIRDEITRRCLDKADAFIVVLSASQPLSQRDVSLLRLLRGLNRDRIIVFINRTDELGDPERDTPKVVEFVRNGLAREIPGFEIPVIAGSARWMISSAQASQVTPHSALLKAAGQEDASDPFKETEIEAKSGMAELKAQLNCLLATTYSANILRKIAQCYQELAQANASVAENDLRWLSKEDGCEQARTAPATPNKNTLSFDQDMLRAAQDVTQKATLKLEVKLRTMLRGDLDKQRKRLTELIGSYAEEERNRLVANRKSGDVCENWVFDARKLRLALRSEFEQEFERSKASLTGFATEVAQNFSKLIGALMPGAVLPKQPEFGLDVVRNPDLSSLGRSMVFDLDSSHWSQLWRTKPSPERCGAVLENLIKNEFYPIVDDLIAAHQTSLESYIDMTTRWSLVVCQNILQMLRRQRGWLDAEFRSGDNVIGLEHRLPADDRGAEILTVLELHQAKAESALQHLLAVDGKISAW